MNICILGQCASKKLKEIACNKGCVVNDTIAALSSNNAAITFWCDPNPPTQNVNVWLKDSTDDVWSERDYALQHIGSLALEHIIIANIASSAGMPVFQLIVESDSVVKVLHTESDALEFIIDKYLLYKY